MTVLIIGERGQLARELARARWPEGMQVRQLGRSIFDLARPQQFQPLLDAGDWSVVVNAAAYTAVDRAESESAAAFAINRDGPEALAQWCAAHGVPLVHVSTDYVFDGAKPAPYVEDDPVRPINVYGASKAAGEEAIRSSCETHLIVRTAWVYSAHGRNFLRTMIRLAAEHDEVRVVDDQIGSPTSATELARSLISMITVMRDGEHDVWGTYHVCSAGETSWYGFASAIFSAAVSHGCPTPKLVPIETSDYPTPAARPANSRLDCAKARRVFGIDPAPWEVRCREVVQELMTSSQMEVRA